MPHCVHLAAAELDEGSTLDALPALGALPLTGGSFMRLSQVLSWYSVPCFRHSANLFTRGLVCKHEQAPTSPSKRNAQGTLLCTQLKLCLVSCLCILSCMQSKDMCTWTSL